MATHFEDTHKELAALAEKHSKVAVAYSGGKDSLCTLDLALRHFKHVYPFFMFLVPGLEFDRQRMQACKAIFNLQPIEVPHYLFIEILKTSTYIDPFPEFDEFPDLNIRAVYDYVRHHTGATLILNGQKKADGFFRRRLIANTKRTQADVHRPLKDWVRWEVLSYLKAQRIPMPSQAQADNSGTSLSNTEVLWFYDNMRSDYEILRSYFPYIETIVLRREWFGRVDG
jgi:phosphoadenosine phosphosulfate reductase